MGFTPKWSTEVKTAVLVLVIDHGLTAREAWGRAVNGNLPQLQVGKPAPGAVPDLPLGTVQDWARDERRRQRQIAAARLAPAEVLGTAIGQMAAMLNGELERAEKLSRRGKLPRGEIAKLAADAKAIAQLVRTVKPEKPGPGAPVQTAEPDGSWIAQLAASPDSGS